MDKHTQNDFLNRAVIAEHVARKCCKAANEYDRRGWHASAETIRNSARLEFMLAHFWRTWVVTGTRPASYPTLPKRL
jgi:hypothetical protein